MALELLVLLLEWEVVDDIWGHWSARATCGKEAMAFGLEMILRHRLDRQMTHPAGTCT